MKAFVLRLLRVLGLAALVLASSRGDRATDLVATETISTDLGNALAKLAWLLHTPMVAELAQPLPNIEIPAGTYVAKDLLHEVARQSPGYDWDIDSDVVLFYSVRLRSAKFNFLNLEFPSFIMPKNLSDLKLTLPTREIGLLQGYSGGGIMIDGFGDATLEKALLRPVTLNDVTGRAVLLRVANEAPKFFTILVFPSASPTLEQAEEEVSRNWFWQALEDTSLRPLYIEPAKSGGQGTRQSP